MCGELKFCHVIAQSFQLYSYSHKIHLMKGCHEGAECVGGAFLKVHVANAVVGARSRLCHGIVHLGAVVGTRQSTLSRI